MVRMLDWFPDLLLFFAQTMAARSRKQASLDLFFKKQRLETQSESSAETNEQSFSSSDAREYTQNSEGDESDSGSKLVY